MLLSQSRLKYRESIMKTLPDSVKNDIGFPDGMPFGRVIIFHQPKGSPYIIIYEKGKYMGERDIVSPKWLATPECLDKRYKIREVKIKLPVHI